MQNDIEFLVSESTNNSNELVVHGIVNSGNIRIGQIFTKIRRKDINGNYFYENINLVVKSISAYRRQIDELPTGMGGGLNVTGDTIKFEANDMLIT